VKQPNGDGGGKPFAEQRPEALLREVQVAFPYRTEREIGSPAGLDLDEDVRVRSIEIGGQPVRDTRTPTGYGPGRISGPVATVAAIAREWRLDPPQLAVLLGYEPYQAEAVARLLSGQASERDRDQKDRIRYLLEIYGLLTSVFQDSPVALAWLREGKQAFGGEAPLARMLRGSMEDLLSVKWLVQHLSGR
jgi:hypothetical protein